MLSTNVELAHEITSWMEGCAARAEGPKGTPLSNLIISYYETGLDRAVALRQMHLLNLQLEGKRAKDLEEFVMVSSLLIDSPRRLCLNGCGSKSKGFPFCFGSLTRSGSLAKDHRKGLLNGFRLRGDPDDMNWEKVVKEQPTKTPKTKGPKKAATSSPAQPAVPRPLEATQLVKTKVPCTSHAAGYCQYGEKCRNHHVGEPGSEAARKFSEHQKSKGQGQ